MPKKPESPRYEVYCNRCRVTFPIGTQRCVHCGGRIHRERFRPQLGMPPELDESMVIAEEEEAVRRPGGFSPLTIVWVLLLIAGYLYQSC